MSLESWRKEYYPVDADKLTSRDDAVLIEASLLKWIGLQEGNLAEHGLGIILNGCSLYVEDINIGCSKQCSLCTKYYGSNVVFNCLGCPLGDCFDFKSPYSIAFDSRYTNLTPLIETLAKALDKELNHK